MRPKPRSKQPQGELFRMRLESLLDHRHDLYKLAHIIDWAAFDERFGPRYDDKVGRPGISTRLMVGLNYLKYATDLSDEAVVAHFVENPYWQYFCGLEFFTHELPINPSSMTRWRKRVGVDGAEELLKQTIATAQRRDYLKPSDVANVNADTTVQEKAIAFPTDSRLYHKAICKLGKQAQRRGIQLRQSYKRKSKWALLQHGRYSHAKQYKRARKTAKKLQTMLGALIRDVRRKCPKADVELAQLLENCERVQTQQRQDKGKLYSLWAPEVECISKGKEHKRYEFGCKVGIVSTSKKSWIVGAQAFHSNPYDGHTLAAALAQTERLTGWNVKNAFCDKGYRGSRESVPKVNVYWPDNRRKDRSLKRWMRRRSAVEPVIGHTKSENRLNRNYLHGQEGDKMNALLAASGFNLRKLLRELSRALFLLLFVMLEGVCGQRNANCGQVPTTA